MKRKTMKIDLSAQSVCMHVVRMESLAGRISSRRSRLGLCVPVSIEKVDRKT